jgi:hypothetical protein
MKSMRPITRLVCSVAFLTLVALVTQARAQFFAGTTWVRTDAEGKGMTMSVAACCNGGYRLTYQIPAMGGQPAMVMTIDSPLNGSDAPTLIGGKPSGQSMAIKRVDDHHYTAVVKLNGQPMMTSTGVVAADNKTMTVEDVSQGRGNGPKTIETWVRK